MKLSTILTLILSVAAATGIVLIVRGIVAARRKGGCGWCGYAVAGLKGTVCPECGQNTGSRKIWRRAWLTMLCGVVLCTLLPWWVIWPMPFRYVWWQIRYPRWKVVDDQADGRWRLVRMTGGRPNNWNDVQQQVLLDGRIVLTDNRSRRALIFEVASGQTRAPLRLDVTGDGVPEFFVTTWSGDGAHCCTTLHVFDEVGSSPLLATIECKHSEPTIADSDGDGVGEIVIGDWTFAYWRTPFVVSPAPEVTLVWSGAAFVPSARHSFKFLAQVNTADAFVRAHLVREVNGHGWTSTSLTALLDVMLELMYNGNEALAWKVFETTWPGSDAAKTEFKDDFLRTLNTSPYWPALQREYAASQIPPPTPSPR